MPSFVFFLNQKPLYNEYRNQIQMESCVMKMLENYSNCLNELKKADFKKAENDIIYRSGVFSYFDMTFETGWKALQAVLSYHGVEEANTGSPREILQLAYKAGFIDDSAVWLQMLKKRNSAAHIYDESEANALILLIHNSFIPAFNDMEKVLREKINEE